MSQLDILKQIDASIVMDRKLYGGPIDQSLLKDIEINLNLKFSSEYVNFIKKYDGIFFGAYNIYGATDLILIGCKLNSVVTETLFYREQNWPGIENCYVISDDGRGNPIYMDSEGKVWLSDHDSGFETILLADSFNEFLIKIYEDRLYD